MTITHHVTRSSMISEIEYNSDEKLLTLTFGKGGQKYNYSDVPKQVYEDLLASDSVGKYFLANIRDKYSTERI